jgi:hypothetical protein
MSGFDEFDEDFDDMEMDENMIAALDGDKNDRGGQFDEFDDIVSDEMMAELDQQDAFGGEQKDDIIDDLDSDAFQEVKMSPSGPLKTPHEKKQRTIMETYGYKSTPQVHVQHRQDAPLRQHLIDQDAVKTWIYPTNLKIRDYQKAIVHTALFTNTLVALPTGLGKTMIAAVVIYNFYRWFPQGKVLLLPIITRRLYLWLQLNHWSRNRSLHALKSLGFQRFACLGLHLV